MHRVLNISKFSDYFGNLCGGEGQIQSFARNFPFSWLNSSTIKKSGQKHNFCKCLSIIGSFIQMERITSFRCGKISITDISLFPFYSLTSPVTYSHPRSVQLDSASPFELSRLKFVIFLSSLLFMQKRDCFLDDFQE